ncbi:head GIN domain-containing protein [Myxococcus stipitatus]|uniref:head GIN domain-containing protein n=1 Tax=Myxococcus stipitatus TaxID=83455 RepID=UPI0030CE248F
MRIGAQVGLVLLAASVAGCEGPHVSGSGRQVEVVRPTPVFDRLELEDGIGASIEVDPDKPHSVRIVGDDNLVALMRTEHSGSRLKVHFADNEVDSWDSPNALRVDIVVPRLEALERSGGGALVDVRGKVDAEVFSLSASGGGYVRLRGLRTDVLEVSLSGSSSIVLEGEASQVKASLSGASRLSGSELASREATLNTSGGGNVVVKVSRALRVSASGGGRLQIIGHPEVLERDLSGGSTLSFE